MEHAVDDSGMGGILLGGLVVFLLWLAIVLIASAWIGEVVVFEDGSFIFGDITGCLPNALCNIGG